MGNIACNMVKQNKSVLLISLEMSEMMYARRIAGSLAGLEVNALRDNTIALKSSIDNIKHKNTRGKLLIKEFPPSTITASQIKSFIDKIKQSGT